MGILRMAKFHLEVQEQNFWNAAKYLQKYFLTNICLMCTFRRIYFEEYIHGYKKN
jgi:hypothetical protein